MDERAVFVLADHALLGVVEQIAPEQWDMVMPADFRTSGSDTEPPTLRRIIGYHAYDDAWVPDMLAGRTMAEVGDEAFKGDLLGEDPVASFREIVDQACAAAEAVPDLASTVHCSFGDFTVQQYFWQITMFRGLRAHDIAQAIGQDTTLAPDLVQGIWDQISPHAEQWRAIGVFPAAVEVPDDASLQDRLLGLTGRRPDSA
jgi:hypothetical protein